MEINLRKARKLEAKIQKAITGNNTELTVEVLASSTDAQAIDEVASAKARLQDQAQNSLKLLETRFSIRRKIEQANEAVGINLLMNQRESINAKLAFYGILSGLDTCSQQEMLDLLAAKRKHLEKGDSFYGKVNVPVSVVSKTEKEALLAQRDQLLKDLEDVEENLIQKNVGAKVTLSADEVSLLQTNGLL